MNIGIYLLTKVYYTWRNKKREEKWNALTKEVRQHRTLTPDVVDTCAGATEISRHDDRFGEQAAGLSVCSLKRRTEDKGTRVPSGCVCCPGRNSRRVT